MEDVFQQKSCKNTDTNAGTWNIKNQLQDLFWEVVSTCIVWSLNTIQIDQNIQWRNKATSYH